MKIYEMLEEQKAIWDMERMYPNSAVGNLGSCLNFYHTEDVRLYQRMNEVFLQTQSACWMKVTREGKIYFDKVTGYATPLIDVRDMDESQFRASVQAWIDEPLFAYDQYLFDLRIYILKDRISVCEKVHHLIMDGYGVVVSLKILEDICEKLRQGIEDFSENVQFIQKVEAASKMDCQPKPLPVSAGELVNYGERAANPGAKRIKVRLVDGHTVDEGRQTASPVLPYTVWKTYLRRYRISPESMFYGCLAIYLCRCQGKRAVAIGRNLLNRCGEDLSLPGMCVKMVPFFVRYREDLTIAEFLAGIKKELAFHAKGQETYELGDEKISMICSYRPLRYMPSLENGYFEEYPAQCCEVPVKFFLNDMGECLELEIRYQEDAVSGDAISRLIQKVIFLMNEAIRNPDFYVGELSILQDTDMQLYRKANSGGECHPQMTLPERFLIEAKRNPEKTAVLFAGKSWSYEQVYHMVGEAVSWIEMYAKREPYIIAVCLKKSPWIPVLMYAAWFKGYSYLPISPVESEERIAKIGETCSLLFTEEFLRQCRQNSDFTVESSLASDKANGARRPAYYMFTSGTTGQPKAAVISHQSLAIRLQWMDDVFGGGMDVVLQKTRSTFDVSMWELAFPWAYGKTMCMLKEGEERDPETIFSALQQNHVTMVHFVPSMFAEFLTYVEKRATDLPGLRYIILSGETLEANLVRRACKCLEHTVLYNLYGPTECTIDVSFYRCRGDEERIPIGTSLYQTGLTVRNAKNQVLPAGEVGELVIEGDLVGEGYSELFSSGEKSGFCVEDGRREYHTGDMAYLGSDGNFYFEGRRDRQKKIRGMRVNLEEVELLLNQAFPKMRQVIVWNKNRMIDFYEGELSKEQVRDQAKKILPYYCIPGEFVQVERICTGSSGKIDRNQLLHSYEKDFQTEGSYNENQFSELWELERVERTLLDLAETILQKNMNLDDSLWETGMDSLLALQFLTLCEENQIKLSVSQIYQSVSLKELARDVYAANKQRKQLPLQFLRDKREETLVLMVPFAGGTPLSYTRLANEMKDLAVDIAVFI